MVRTIVDARSIKFNEAMVTMKRSELDDLWNQYQETTAALLASVDLDDAESLARDDDENMDLANLYYVGAEVLNRRMAKLKAARARPATVKPFEIVLPKFVGRYTSWISWRSQFVSKVKDSELAAADKIDLLLSALSGEACQCTGETEHRDGKDLCMWAKLEAIYDNKYLPIMTSPSPDTLRKIVDTVEQELYSLERFDYMTDSWDPLVAVIILRKLDPLTIGVWEMDRDPVKPPSLKDVLPFLEKRILAIRNLKVMHVQPERNPTNAVAHSSQQPGKGSRNPFTTK